MIRGGDGEGGSLCRVLEGDIAGKTPREERLWFFRQMAGTLYYEGAQGQELRPGQRVTQICIKDYLSIDLIKCLLYNMSMDIFTALADPTRRKIMEMLAKYGQLSATEIYDQFPVSPQAISQHLKILREVKLVQVEKRAQQRIYQINPDAMLELEGWANRLRQLWNQRFDALDKVLEAKKKRLKGVVK